MVGNIHVMEPNFGDHKLLVFNIDLKKKNKKSGFCTQHQSPTISYNFNSSGDYSFIGKLPIH